MGRFILTRTEAGVQFTLRSERERVLAVSKDYATLDACKKAVCSLVQCASDAPVVFHGEGSRPNPKIEVTETVGGFFYEVKAPNGKSVLTAGPFATRKACLRAISMLRAGVQNAAVSLEFAGIEHPLTVGKLMRKA